MIMSVSTLSIGSGAATPVNVVNLSIRSLFNFSALPRLANTPACARSAAATLHAPRGLPNGALSGNAPPSPLQKPLEVLRRFFRRALDVERLDESAGLVHQVDDR